MCRVRSIPTLLSLLVLAAALPLRAQTTTWASVQGGSGNYHNAVNPTISDDGRYVAYQSVGIDDPLDGCIDILVYDSVTGSTVSLTGCDSQATPPGQFSSLNADFTADGSDIVYERFVPADAVAPGTLQIHYHHVSSGASHLVSVNTAGERGDSSSTKPSVSANGQHIAFESFADNLVPEPTGFNYTDVFVHDRASLKTTLVSEAFGGGAGGNSVSHNVDLSASGRHVAFASQASDLLPPGVDTNNVIDVFVRDRDPDGNNTFDEPGAVTVRVSISSAGVQANNHGFNPTISGDGRYVAFETWATSLAPDDNNAASDIYVHDRDPDGNAIYDEGNGETYRVSNSSAGDIGIGSSQSPAFSRDGHSIAFWSLATNFSAYSTPGLNQIYLHELDTGLTKLVSVTDGGLPGDKVSGVNGGSPAVSGNGSRIAFPTYAENLDPTDTNTWIDVYLHERGVDTSINLGSGSIGPSGLQPVLTMVGDLVLAELGKTTTFRVRQAPPLAGNLLLWSFSTAYAPAYGGTLVPAAPFVMRGPFTDALGATDIVVTGVGGPSTVYVQSAVKDGAGWALSNALEVPVPPGMLINP